MNISGNIITSLWMMKDGRDFCVFMLAALGNTLVSRSSSILVFQCCFCTVPRWNVCITMTETSSARPAGSPKPGNKLLVIKNFWKRVLEKIKLERMPYCFTFKNFNSYYLILLTNYMRKIIDEKVRKVYILHYFETPVVVQQSRS